MKIRKIFQKLLWFQLLLLSVIGMFGYNVIVSAEDAEEWMPDPALREAVREKLGIPVDTPLTQAYVQLRLTNLDAREKGIVDLTGLEHATDLQFLVLIRNDIHDLSPLSGITGLVFIDLGGNQISDLSPLAGLVNLEVLKLGGNQIRDVSPLAGLVNLKTLVLSYNQIADISSLAGLENLENLRIRNNEKRVLWTLPISKLIQFGYDEACDLEGVPIAERVEDREHPSIFSAWANIINLPSLSWHERLAYHDLHWSSLLFDMKWLPTPEGLRTFLHVETAKNERDDLLSRNPNMIFIVSMNYQAANPGEYPEDWPYWLRDESGNRIKEHQTILIDFTYPEVQDYLVRQVIEFAKCGLFDGIFLDWWRDDWRDSDMDHYYAYDVSEAAITMLRRMREGVDAVRDDFLIIANGNRTKLPRSAPYINGTFMETIEPYSYKGLAEIESTLLWSEQNLQEPQINCLEGWADKREPIDGPRNQQWMRLFTTMSLTHSDGYVNFVRGLLPNHTHLYEIQEGHSEVHARGELHSHGGNYWYPFYDAPLGRPVGGDETKGQLYENREGLFIREFTNGWAVYNRSGKEQQIEFSEAVSRVASGVEEKRSHTLPDLDGEIYLKSESGLETPPTTDVNGDGFVNIQDLVIVANALGKAEPDLNGDGVVNIQDLVIVANAF
ncbi:MAG: leucine-rich repeat domain-containing protein [Candidatus Poribacteria bacterium]|nr:leucine-rich repeat domain-containing protein [Candidatus Poribacteria bacterium]